MLQSLRGRHRLWQTQSLAVQREAATPGAFRMQASLGQCLGMPVPSPRSQQRAQAAVPDLKQPAQPAGLLAADGRPGAAPDTSGSSLLLMPLHPGPRASACTDQRQNPFGWLLAHRYCLCISPNRGGRGSSNCTALPMMKCATCSQPLCNCNLEGPKSTRPLPRQQQTFLPDQQP